MNFTNGKRITIVRVIIRSGEALLILLQQSHVCNVFTKEAVSNLAENLPDDVTAKLAHAYISSQMTAKGDCQPVLLPSADGGHPLSVKLVTDTK